ncbi:MAG: beta-lactamase family protein [Cyclobacteriaceae bacterium]|nr:beta-lactamase family protein [Cyclobacteriaceae bacterium]MCB0498451.1 beta-lactamase family protein [Cyclobacteriaceae bacterium]MCO5271622.1 beta-lactamase family protein [Cyclobacteriaceae bacterium]MCW5901311.1 beta-lactamase family protein [Cyclobacteriaceae bacterium]
MTDASNKINKKRTKRIVRIVLFLGTAISLYFVPWLLVWAWLRPLPNSMQGQAKEAIGYGFSGVVVYVDQKGKPPGFYTAGWHDPAKKIPAKAGAYFKIGSIGKLYKAVAIAKLVSDGRLDLDKTLADYLPGLAGRIENAGKITLKMLAQHRSGIPNYTDTPDYWAHPKETADERLGLILDQPARFAPGEKYEYGNTNYLLLNKIMDKVLGYNNFQYIREEILAPLNLHHTFASIKDVDIGEVMSGYHQGHEGDLKTDDIGMIATAEDVGIFIRALNTGTLLTGKEREIYSSIYKYQHSGWVPGYQAFAGYDGAADTVMVTFYGTTDPDLIFWNLAEIINGRFAKIWERNAG